MKVRILQLVILIAVVSAATLAAAQNPVHQDPSAAAVTGTSVTGDRAAAQSANQTEALASSSGLSDTTTGPTYQCGEDPRGTLPPCPAPCDGRFCPLVSFFKMGFAKLGWLTIR